MEIKSILVTADNISDYVPVLSSVTNLVDLFEMAVVLPNLNKVEKENNHYWKHLEGKSAVRCFFLLIPFLGNLFVGLWDFAHKKYDDPDELLAEIREGDTYKFDFASDRLYDDADFMSKAYTAQPYRGIDKKFSERLRADKKFMLDVLKQSTQRYTVLTGHQTGHVSEDLMGIVSNDLKKDPDFMLELIKRDHNVATTKRYIDLDLRNNQQFMLKVLAETNNAHIAEIASDELKENQEFFLAAMKIQPSVLMYAGNILKHNEEFLDAVNKVGGWNAIQFCAPEEFIKKYFPKD